MSEKFYDQIFDTFNTIDSLMEKICRRTAIDYINYDEIKELRNLPIGGELGNYICDAACEEQGVVNVKTNNRYENIDPIKMLKSLRTLKEYPNIVHDAIRYDNLKNENEYFQFLEEQTKEDWEITKEKLNLNDIAKAYDFYLTNYPDISISPEYEMKIQPITGLMELERFEDLTRKVFEELNSFYENTQLFGKYIPETKCTIKEDEIKIETSKRNKILI